MKSDQIEDDNPFVSPFFFAPFQHNVLIIDVNTCFIVFLYLMLMLILVLLLSYI
jgi:hypothetical protein